MDGFILEHAKESPALDALRRSILQTDPGALLCVEMLRRPRGRSAAAARRARARPRASRLRADRRRFAGRSRRASGACASRRSGLSMAMKGDDEVAVLRRGHRGRAREAARLHRTIPRDRAAPRHVGRRLRPRVGRLPARAAGRQHEDGGRRRGASRRSRTTSPTSCSSSAARCPASTATAWCAARSRRRCSGRRSTRRSATVKRTFDPARRLQPGQDRRYAAADGEPALRRRLPDAAIRRRSSITREHGGLGRAVEMCSGLGACRKKLDGTMCPSYMATREEKHSTRGRANTLRLAMTGRLGEAGPRRRRRATRCSTCASSAARARRSVPSASTSRGSRASSSPTTGAGTACRSARACSATCATLSKWGSRFAPLSNAWRAAARPLDEREAARHRSAPQAAAGVGDANTFAQRCAGGQRRRDSGAAGRRDLFNDTFTNYNDPDIGIAAVRRARRGGRRTRASSPHGCCGRPLISKGLLDEARALRAEECGRAVRRRIAGRADSVSRAELPVCGSRRRAGAAARRGAAQGARRRRRVRAVRGISRAGIGRPDASLDLRSRTGDDPRCTATVIRSRWGCWRPRARCCRAFPSAPWSISTPAAAAWRARSATPETTTTCRGRSANAGCCPPHAR